MKCKVMGIQNVNYTNKANKKITGTTFHVTHPDSRVNGDMCENIFLSDRLQLDVINQVKLGDTIDVSYNRYGSIDSLSICK